jgi:hypothetical protein
VTNETLLNPGQQAALDAALARVYRLPDALTHQLLVNGELNESREDFTAEVAATLNLPEELVDAALERRPLAIAGVGALMTYAAEAAVDPTTLDVAVAVSWSQSDEAWEQNTTKVPRATAASLSRALRLALVEMAGDVDDLAGTESDGEKPDIETFTPPKARTKRRAR